MSNARNDYSDLPDWWQRERRRRQVLILVFLGFLLALIAFYYWTSYVGRVTVAGIDIPTRNYVAFVRTERPQGHTALQSGVFMVRADGTDTRRLTPTDDVSDKASPAWTIDGKEILYSSNKNDVTFRQIFILGAGEPRQLTYGKSNKDSPVASPDGQHVGFISEGAVKSILLNGNDPYQLMPTPRAGNSDSEDAPGGAGEMSSAFLSCGFSSDGSSVAGVQETNNMLAEANIGGAATELGDQIVRVLLPNGSDPLFLDTGHECSFAWDPTSPRIACTFTELDTRGPTGKSQMVSGIRTWTFPNSRMAVPKPLFAAMGYSIEPKNVQWSPDGKRLAFDVWKVDSNGDRSIAGIAVLEVTDMAVRFDASTAKSMPYMVAAGPNGKPSEPKWSPDGNRLLYEMERPSGGHDIWVVNADGTNPVNLTNGVGDNTQAVWSPAK